VSTKTSDPSPAARRTVFISYSHKDEAWKDRVVGHLKVLGIDDELEVWDDRQIAKGDAWLPEIQGAMDRAAVAVLLISKDFLSSGFIRGTEVPHLLKRRREEGLRVIPLFVHPCAWQAVDWLAAVQGGPKDAKTLSEHRKAQADKILADLALEIQGWLKDGREGPIREAPNGGAGIKPGVSTPGGEIPQTTPSPERAQALPRGGGGMPASLRDSPRLDAAAPQEDLEALSPEAGAELLKKLGVKGPESELLAASQEFGNHALTLSLLGGYLSRARGGDVRRRKDVNLVGADQIKDGHALRVIATYANWLREGPEVVILRMLGLFDRPADPGAIAALRAKPVIPWLTEPLMDLSEEAWQLALSNLREHGLLLPADPHQPDVLDAPPLVRAYFQEYLKSEQPEGWQAGNLRLDEYFQKEARELEWLEGQSKA
jgi:hypothetical protein